jgi:hypothetical protein
MFKMFSYIRKVFGEDYSKLLNDLISALPFRVDSEAEIWGPVVEYSQTVAARTGRQKCVSVLIHASFDTSNWILVKQTNELHNGCEWTSRPVVTELNDTAALAWLEAKHLSVPATTSKVRAR